MSFLLFTKLYSQVDVGEDVQINAGTPIQLQATFTGDYGIMIAAWDDAFEGPFPIGFEFTFFGQNFNEVFIGPNGIISFDSNPPTYYQNVPEIPGVEILKSIMGPYQDLFTRPLDNPHTQYMYYRTIGEAPNRKFVAGWCEAPMYICDDQKSTLQIVLEESSNIIYNHLINKPECLDHIDNLATQGLNYDGNIGIAVPGRNRSSWVAQNESWKFVPENSTDYLISQIEFAPEFVLPEANLKWKWYKDKYPDGEVIGDISNKIVAPLETTTYFCEITMCGGTTFVDEVTVKVIPVPNAFNPISNSELNRTFVIPMNESVELSSFQMYIYNRWGQEVFKSSDPHFGWDGTFNGTECLSGVYVWIINYEAQGEIISSKGNVTLIR